MIEGAALCENERVGGEGMKIETGGMHCVAIRL